MTQQHGISTRLTPDATNTNMDTGSPPGTQGKKPTKRKRRGPRLNLPAKKRREHGTSDQSSIDDLERGCPSLEEFNQWTRFRCFVVKDENDEPVAFETGGYGIIVHGTGNKQPGYLHEYWVGRILEIRSKGRDPSQVWAKVEWLWSTRDITEVTKQVDTKAFGSMERLSCDIYDFVHSSCFQDVAHVIHFDECSPEPPLISDETFYVRYTFDLATKSIKPKVKPTCLCDKPYNPDEASSMHFCPRKDCNKAYHASCLKRRGYAEKIVPPPRLSEHKINNNNTHNAHLHTPPKTPFNTSHTSQGKNGKTTGNMNTDVPRFLQFERTLPNSTLRDSRKAVPSDLIGFTMIPSSPISPVNASVSQTPPVNEKQGQDRLTFTRYKLIPPPLLALARSPMVRGNTDKTGLDEEIGRVAGNIAFVARARKIVERVVRGGEPLGEEGEWVKELGLPWKEVGKDDSILKTKPEEEVMRWVAQDKGFLCPSCGGVV